MSLFCKAKQQSSCVIITQELCYIERYGEFMQSYRHQQRWWCRKHKKLLRLPGRQQQYRFPLVHRRCVPCTITERTDFGFWIVVKLSGNRFHFGYRGYLWIYRYFPVYVYFIVMETNLICPLFDIDPI